MREHRRTEGLAWAVALLGVLVGVSVFFFNMKAGWLILVGALVVACIIYYR